MLNYTLASLEVPASSVILILRILFNDLLNIALQNFYILLDSEFTLECKGFLLQFRSIPVFPLEL